MSADASSEPGLAAALQQYMQARTAALITARKELQIGELDARALLFIADHPGTRPSMLRDYLGITSAGVTTLVDRLAERGAVRREVDAQDRRVNRLSVAVDLTGEPWSALTRFDRDFSAAIDAGDPRAMADFASALSALTTTTTGAAHASAGQG
ncbi:MarR family winged helix-turn-helix transcriptional regulator [Agromyces aerolatus]|uniref:MarR family winged helix-turn-helix transcriptional regulator n=1 Tax=Agromyces sp. LY-1074 TaxID=3074080 RepID=UPI00285F3BA2|nr:MULTISPECIES: helix-turn-helix domain-containing protein [unclassified Agromyces]MDR5699193.1 helix-turn-helix domain-containing protein [Agromyces sp. LY-1074]MDR5705488.1 helix-turn-helix domain-containing protein [Agromyces sp. LY-1358]